MRKFLVRNFVLDYRVKIFGKCFNAPRASRIIFPLFVITGLANSFNQNFPTPTPFIWFLYFLVALSLFFGFVYFSIKPVKYSELDRFQKLQYGFIKFEELTPSEMSEWQIIRNRYEQTGDC